MTPARWLTIALIGLLAEPAPADEQRYTFLTLGKNEGGMRVLARADRLSVDFQFNDRGRGPQLHEEIVLDASGLPLRYSVTGRAYMGGAVEETFIVEGDTATWRSNADAGERRIERGHLYVPAAGTPQTLAVAVRALAGAGGRLPALPDGSLVLRELRSAEAAANDARRRIRLYAIDGLDLTPSYVWLDEDMRLFAVSFGWSSLISEGWEAEAERLAALQREADAAHLASLQQRFARRYAQPVAIRGARLFDALEGRLGPASTVVVFDGEIGAVYDHSVEVPGAVTIEADGMTLLPGLFDMHDHIGGWSNLLQVAGGVTSVRDLANNNEQLLELLGRLARSEVIGPRVFLAGFIDQRGPYSGPGGVVAGSLEEALAGVDWYANHAFRQIKLYSSIDPDWVAPIAAATHERQMRLSGHIPAFMTAEQAVRAGYDEIQHINMIFLNFVASARDDTRTPVRFLAVAERAGDLDLDSQAVRDFIDLLVERNVVVDPTVTIFEDMFLNRSGVPSPPYAMVHDRFPVSLQRSLLAETLPITDANEAIYRRSFQALLDMIGRLYRAGVRLVPGTDGLSGFTLYRELENYVAAGIPAARVLQLATIDSARLVEADQSLGSITPGKRADLLLVDGDPLEDISDIRRVVWVMRDGVAYDPVELYAAVGIRPLEGARRVVVREP